ncbi:MAG: helix-turn-helix transcriptional regulator [Actinomycetota bacterium]|nr:helix-turn-helix transcriptional regulator [Actinomycetota bacterium]
MTPGTLLTQARRQARLTQQELAVRAGTSQPVISAYEHDKRDPGVATLRKLLAAAGRRLELRTAHLGTTADDERTAPDPATNARKLVDVLLLADAIPHRPRGELTFPSMRST